MNNLHVNGIAVVEKNDGIHLKKVIKNKDLQEKNNYFEVQNHRTGK
jgi:hypothetical protein